MTKTCWRCKQSLPADQFHRNSRHKDGLQARCKSCSREIAQEYRATRRLAIREQSRIYGQLNPERRRDSLLRNQYGITLAQYEYLLERQGGLCAVCRHTCTAGRSLSVDHNHETGAVRGLLCHRCNRVAGLMDDRPEMLVALADYLLAEPPTIPQLESNLPPIRTPAGQQIAIGTEER